MVVFWILVAFLALVLSVLVFGLIDDANGRAHERNRVEKLLRSEKQRQIVLAEHAARVGDANCISATYATLSLVFDWERGCVAYSDGYDRPFVVLPFSQIRAAEVEVNDAVIATTVSKTKKSTASVVGRAALGGLVAGSPGAILGGMTASAQTASSTQYQPTLEGAVIRLKTRDRASPLVEWSFYDGGGVFPINSVQSETIIRECRRVHALLELAMEEDGAAASPLANDD